MAESALAESALAAGMTEMEGARSSSGKCPGVWQHKLGGLDAHAPEMRAAAVAALRRRAPVHALLYALLPLGRRGIVHVSDMYLDVSRQDTSRYIKIHQDTTRYICICHFGYHRKM